MTLTSLTEEEFKRLIGYEEVAYTHRFDDDPGITGFFKQTRPGGDIYEAFTRHLDMSGIIKPFEQVVLPLRLAYENAFEHGEPPVRTDILKGSKGAIARITDHGEGFDYATAIEDFRRQRATTPESNGYGVGFDVFEDIRLLCAYQGRGNIITLGLYEA